MIRHLYDYSNWPDVKTQFNELVKEFSKPNIRILDVGASSTNSTTAFLAGLGDVTGIDIAPKVEGNQHCKERIVYDGVHIPCNSTQFDLVVSDYVLEHVEYPLELCREIRRVLRPGGHFIFRTVNLWHYFSLVAKLSPHWFHAIVYRKLFKKAHDEPYPTFYRMNSMKKCRIILTVSGFEIKVMKGLEGKPPKAMASRLMFYPLMMWGRILNSNALLENLRSNILCVATTK